MSIDAVIERIRRRDEGLRLELAPRVERDGKDSIAGQPALTILGPRTREPVIGDEIWGNASTVLIGPTSSGMEYDRRGVRLREKRLCLGCEGEMHWACITNTETGEQRDVRFCETCGREERPDAR